MHCVLYDYYLFKHAYRETIIYIHVYNRGGGMARVNLVQLISLLAMEYVQVEFCPHDYLLHM